jgi:hypothetical protein
MAVGRCYRTIEARLAGEQIASYLAGAGEHPKGCSPVWIFLCGRAPAEALKRKWNLPARNMTRSQLRLSAARPRARAP